MADAVSTHVLYEDKSHYVAKFTNISDGNGESDVVKVDVSTLTLGSTTTAPAEVDILGLWFSTDGMAVRVEFGADTDTVAWLVPANQTGYMDFRQLSPGPGGIRNNSSTGKTGDVKFTTIGHTSGDTYTIILECKKRLTAEV